LTNTTDDLMTPEEVAELARVPIDTLRYWRHRKMGPPSFRLGRRIRYRRSVVLEWIAQQEREAREAS
jgi:excisionase family DNA binding protein